MALAGSVLAEDTWVQSGSITLDYTNAPRHVEGDATLYNYLYGVFQQGGSLTFATSITWDGTNCNAYQSILHVGRGTYGGTATGFSIYANGGPNLIVTERENTGSEHEATIKMIEDVANDVIITLTGLPETGSATASITINGEKQSVKNLTWDNMAWDTSENEADRLKERIKYSLGQKAPGYSDNLIRNLTIDSMTVTYTAAPSIPEPATATLSLLALCGLASRRRRK